MDWRTDLYPVFLIHVLRASSQSLWQKLLHSDVSLLNISAIFTVCPPFVKEPLCSPWSVAASHRDKGYKCDASLLRTIWSDLYSCFHGLLRRALPGCAPFCMGAQWKRITSFWICARTSGFQEKGIILFSTIQILGGSAAYRPGFQHMFHLHRAWCQMCDDKNILNSDQLQEYCKLDIFKLEFLLINLLPKCAQYQTNRC